MRRLLFITFITALSFSTPAQISSSGILKSEFIYEVAPFPECHASTIAESRGNLVAAWFGGTKEKNPDVGIWVSRYENGRWTTPVEVANGIESPQKRYPTWNPVLHQPKTGQLLLFYKVGPSPSQWWGMMTTSDDGGKTWNRPQRLPDGIAGPIKINRLSSLMVICCVRPAPRTKAGACISSAPLTWEKRGSVLSRSTMEKSSA